MPLYLTTAHKLFAIKDETWGVNKIFDIGPWPIQQFLSHKTNLFYRLLQR